MFAVAELLAIPSPETNHLIGWNKIFNHHQDILANIPQEKNATWTTVIAEQTLILVYATMDKCKHRTILRLFIAVLQHVFVAI